MLNDDEVHCWGLGLSGQHGHGFTDNIGDDEAPSAYGPVALSGVPVAIESGDAHSCAVFAGGGLQCWGYNGSGELGLGDMFNLGGGESPDSRAIIDVPGEAISVSAGLSHTCAVFVGGAVRCWGQGISGQLGLGNTDTIGDDELPSSVGPVPVGVDVIEVAAGWQHTCARTELDEVYCWGEAQDGQLGYGNTDIIGDDEPPSDAGPVDIGGSAAQIAAGLNHSCVLLDDGSVRCWGRGFNGQLGYGNMNNIGDDETPASIEPVDVGGSATQIALGYRHTCALLDDGSVRCWGLGEVGQLGTGAVSSVGDDEPPSAVEAIDIGGQVVSISSAADHTCAITTTNHVRCWGSGDAGRLGYGNTDNIGDDEPPSAAGNVDWL